MTSRIIDSVKDFFGIPDTKGNRLKMLFSKNIHSHSVKVSKNIEIEYILYHTSLNEAQREIIEKTAKDISKDLGGYFKIVFGGFIGCNNFHRKAELFKDLNYDPNNKNKDYFYIQIDVNGNGGATNLVRQIKKEAVKAALLYIDYLYKDNEKTSREIVLTNLIPLFYNIDNILYTSRCRGDVQSLIHNSLFSKEGKAAYSLLKVYVDKFSLEEIVYDKDACIYDHFISLFLEIIAYCRETTDIYKEWIGDINKAILRKEISELLKKEERNHFYHDSYSTDDITF